jgi:hypothetical protein
VIIATPDTHAAIKMDSISVSALAVDKVNGQDSYRAQFGGTNACTVARVLSFRCAAADSKTEVGLQFSWAGWWGVNVYHSLADNLDVRVRAMPGRFLDLYLTQSCPAHRKLMPDLKLYVLE